MRFVIFAIAFLLSGVLSASSASGGTLQYVHFLSSGIVLFYTTGTRSAGVPSCALNQQSRFAIDGTSSGGKVQLAGLLTAYSTGKVVLIYGSGNCGVYGDTETISYFHTAD